MSDDKASLHIDSDWKKQAQEEKRRLAEQSAAKATAPPPTQPAQPAGPAEPAAPRGRAAGQMPQATFVGLVQSMLTQTLYYLGDLTGRGVEPTVNLDMAKYQIDTLSLLEEKTRNNLTEEEKRLMDTVLYEARMRYVSVASQYT